MLKKEVLRNRKDFSRIYGKGKSIGDRYVVLFHIKNGLDYNRTAFLASKKVGNSVQRNRARRLMKESWKRISADIPTGYDFIIIGRNSINGRKCREVEDSLRHAVRRTKLRASDRKSKNSSEKGSERNSEKGSERSSERRNGK